MTETANRKRHLRELAHANRRSQDDRQRLSLEIWARVRKLPAYRDAGPVMYYVDRGTEVETRGELTAALALERKAVVPYCVGGDLELFQLKDMDELEVRTFGILEPKTEFREVEARRGDVGEIDVIIVPGVAFDARGGRLGHGRGYYDKLLQHARPDAALIALAFECQLFPEIPMQSHDVYMDMVVTEKAVYRGRGRTSGFPA